MQARRSVVQAHRAYLVAEYSAGLDRELHAIPITTSATRQSLTNQR